VPGLATFTGREAQGGRMNDNDRLDLANRAMYRGDKTEARRQISALVNDLSQQTQAEARLRAAGRIDKRLGLAYIQVDQDWHVRAALRRHIRILAYCVMGIMVALVVLAKAKGWM